MKINVNINNNSAFTTGSDSVNYNRYNRICVVVVFMMFG